MNTISCVGLYNQPIAFQSKVVRNVPRKIRNNKPNSDKYLENMKDERIKSLKTLIEQNPKVGDIYEKLNKKEINLDDAAKEILNAIV